MMGMRHTGKASRVISVSLVIQIKQITDVMAITVTGSLTMTASVPVMVFCRAMVSELMRDIKSPVLDRAKNRRKGSGDGQTAGCANR
jgi:hypothetical protein